MDIEKLLTEGVVIGRRGNLEVVLRYCRDATLTAPEPPPEVVTPRVEAGRVERAGRFKQMDLAGPILEQIGRRPLTAWALSKALKVQHSTAQKHANRLVMDGRLAKTQEGIYRLPHPPTAFHRPGELESLVDSLRGENGTAPKAPAASDPQLLRRIAGLLDVGPQPIAKIIEVTGASLPELNIGLGDLIRSGHVERHPGNTFSLIRRLEN